MGKLRRIDGLTVGRKWFELVKIFGGKQGAPTNGLRPEHDQRQHKQQGNHRHIG